MGEPIKIRYLAEQMIKLAEKVPEQDIKIIYTGLRPGEKLYEEYFYSNEPLHATSHRKILRAKSLRCDFTNIQHICLQLEKLCQISHTDEKELIKLLKMIVPEYQAPSEIEVFPRVSVEEAV